MQYKGGNVTLNCGGIGPDEYMFRALPHGKWWRVYLRTKEGRQAYLEDKAAMVFVMRRRSKRVCLSDAQRVWERLQAQGRSHRRMPFAQFAIMTANNEYGAERPRLLEEIKR